MVENLDRRLLSRALSSWVLHPSKVRQRILGFLVIEESQVNDVLLLLHGLFPLYFWTE
jgi:hypothetical protein